MQRPALRVSHGGAGRQQRREMAPLPSKKLTVVVLPLALSPVWRLNPGILLAQGKGWGTK